MHLRRRAPCHARRRQPRPRQPRPLSARLHGLRGAARHLQGVHRHPARGRPRLRLLRRRSAPRDPRPWPVGAASSEDPCNPTASDRRRGDATLGGHRARGSTARCSSTSSILITSIARDQTPCRLRQPARDVEDVDKHPVLLFDGPTKNGDPGCATRRSVPARSSTARPAGSRRRRVEPPAPRCCSSSDHVVKETRAIQDVFRKKRDRMLAGLESWVRFDCVPDRTFYCWGNVAISLPTGR